MPPLHREAPEAISKTGPPRRASCGAFDEKASRVKLGERLFMKMASWNDDVPQDHRGVFGELGYDPEQEVIGYRYHPFQITKR